MDILFTFMKQKLIFHYLYIATEKTKEKEKEKRTLLFLIMLEKSGLANNN